MSINDTNTFGCPAIVKSGPRRGQVCGNSPFCKDVPVSYGDSIREFFGHSLRESFGHSVPECIFHLKLEHKHLISSEAYCTAITLKGVQCSCLANPDSNVCYTHSKPSYILNTKMRKEINYLKFITKRKPAEPKPPKTKLVRKTVAQLKSELRELGVIFPWNARRPYLVDTLNSLMPHGVIIPTLPIDPNLNLQN